LARQYYIAPCNPVEWQTSQSDLIIDPVKYRQQLEDKWAGIKFHEPSEYSLLAWSLLVSEEGAMIYGALQNNKQIVWLEFPHIDFFLWHRSVISSKHNLFLFTASSFNSLELKMDTARETVEQFLSHA
jgi:hypothetical protein